jgi:integrase/recombinase XerD
MSSTHASAGTALTVAPTGDDRPALLATADGLAAAFLAGYGPATREAYARDLRAWGRFLGRLGVYPLDGRRVHVDAFVREAEDAGVASATLARRLSAMAGFYLYAIDEAVIERSPVARVRRPRVGDESPRSGITREEVRALLDAAARASARDNALATLLTLSGVRVSEAVGADVAGLDVERGHRVLRVRRKGGKVQRLALAPRTAAALDAWLDGRTEGPLFDTRTGRRMDRRAAGKVIARLGREAGVSRPLSPTRCGTRSRSSRSTPACRCTSCRTAAGTARRRRHVGTTRTGTRSTGRRRTCSRPTLAA